MFILIRSEKILNKYWLFSDEEKPAVDFRKGRKYYAQALKYRVGGREIFVLGSWKLDLVDI